MARTIEQILQEFDNQEFAPYLEAYPDLKQSVKAWFRTQLEERKEILEEKEKSLPTNLEFNRAWTVMADGGLLVGFGTKEDFKKLVDYTGSIANMVNKLNAKITAMEGEE